VAKKVGSVPRKTARGWTSLSGSHDRLAVGVWLMDDKGSL
jgi:hypothetical protein